MNIPNRGLLGIGKISRRALQKVLAGTKGVITPKEVSKLLEIDPQKARNLLSYWLSKGWLQRVKRGVYVPIPLESEELERPIEDPWVVANHLYSPCYISGFTAAQYWDFTEQIIESVAVFTEKKVKASQEKVGNVTFILKRISRDKSFGLKKVWRESIPVYLADASRTIVDLLTYPSLGGGIISVGEILLEYLRSEHVDDEKLLEYISRLGNRTVYKRLGFLLEYYNQDEECLVEECKRNISKGYSQLDPSVKGRSLSKRWRIWYPRSFKVEK